VVVGVGLSEIAAAFISGRITLDHIPALASTLSQGDGKAAISLQVESANKQNQIRWLSASAGGFIKEEEGSLEIVVGDSAELDILPILRHLHETEINHLIECGPETNFINDVHPASQQFDNQFQFEAISSKISITLHDLYCTLARLWIAGFPVDRLAVEAKRSTLRTHIPTYPFERSKYWVNPSVTPAPVLTTTRETDSEYLRWLNEVVWSEYPIPADQFDAMPLAGHMLVLASEHGSGIQLAQSLRSQGSSVEIILLNELEEKLLQTDQEHWLVYLDQFESEKVAHEEVQSDIGAGQLLRIAQIIMRTPVTHQPQGIFVFTTESQLTEHGQERLRPERAMVAGLGLALNDEIGIPTQVVDFGSEQYGDGWLRIASDELKKCPDSVIVAWRNGRRYRREIAPLQAQWASAGQNGSAVHREGVYLITGGAGGVGSAIARGIALDVAPTLILVGRKPPGEVQDRADLLGKLRWVGAVADYVDCDLTNPEQVDALMARIQERYGELTGIIHAAGVIRPGRLVSKTKDQLEEVMAPKVKSPGLLIDSIQRYSLQPELFVTFSSIVSVLSGFSGGLGDYAAANAYLDAFALATHVSGMKVTTINWTVWSDTGKGATPILLDHLARQGLEGIRSDEAYQVFRAALADGRHQFVVVNSGALRRPNITEITAEFTTNSTIAAPKKMHKTPPGTNDEVTLVAPESPSRRADSIKNLLVKLLAEELEKEPEEIAIDRSFTSLDLDSMGAIDLVLTLEKEGFGNLPATLFFEYNTIEKLANHLAQLPTGQPKDHKKTEPILTTDSPVLLAGQEENECPLNPVQLAFYTNHRLRPDDVAYAFVRLTVRGTLNIEQLQLAVERLVVNHPSLRTTFEFNAERRRPVQIIYPADTQGFSPQLEHTKTTGDLSRLEDEIANRQLDISNGEVMRVVIASAEEPDQWHLLVHLHHIVADGWSLSLLAQELWLHYFALMGLDVVCPPPPRSDISDYMRMLQEEADGSEREEVLAWWRSTLSRREHFSMRLPFDGNGQRDSMNQRALRFSLDEQLSEKLQQLAAENELSLFHLLLAIYYRCLQQWTDESDIVIGIAEARRDYALPDIQRLVGCFADVFPLYIRLEEDEALLSLARRVRDRWLKVHAHSHLSSIDLVRMFPSDGTDNEPQLLSQANFSFARFPIDFPQEMPIEVVDILGRTATAVTRLSLVCWDFDNRLHFTWNYPAHLFKKTTIAGFADDFSSMARKAAKKPTIVEISVEPEREAPSFLEQIANQWQQYPERAAITGADYRLSYGDLAQQVGYWTSRLNKAGIALGDVVAFLGEPSAEAVIALLAVLRMGATWLPIDPKNPPQRIQYQLETTGAKALVYTSDVANLTKSFRGIVRDLIRFEQITNDVVVPSAASVDKDDIAYIIFTSGSTGKPKGVPITYRALDHYLNWAFETFEYGPNDVVILVTSLAFDASLRQCLAPLMGGSAIRPVNRESVSDPRLLSAILARERISIWSSVPSLWLRLLTYIERQAEMGRLPVFPDLRLIQLGGEALGSGPVRRWQAHYADQNRLVNLYGPTETTISATCYFLPGRLKTLDKRIPIGEALPGRVLRVVDEKDQMCEPGVTGELLIGGIDLSPGYLHDSKLTEKKFVTVDGERFFRTGDLVVVHPNGSLVFVGRNDTQVKVRGYRIELEEIEQVLATHSQIRQAAVVLVEEEREQRLVAFLEMPGSMPTISDLRGFAEQQMPVYMIPHRFQVLQELPLLVNGKIDRNQLKNIAQSDPVSILDTSHGAKSWPLTERELTLAEIWKQVLAVRAVYREDDFFSLGGDSLNVLEVLVALESSGLTVESAADLYRHRSLVDQAQILTPIETPSRQRIPKADRKPFPLSPAQTGFLMTRSFSPPMATTWSAYFWLEGQLDVDVFNHALMKLVERHPMLRTVCLPEERPPLQVEVVPEASLSVRYEELEPGIIDEPKRLEFEIASRLQEENSHLFDLSSWPLIRMRLCHLRNDRHIWFVAADHFIGDAFSGWLFGSELLQMYDSMVEGESSTLPPLRTSFRDYVPLALERESKSDESTVAFWQKMFREPYILPTDWYHETKTSTDGSEWLHEVLELENEQFLGLKKHAAERGQTAHDTLLSLFYRRLAILTGRTDLVVGTAVAGRDYPLPDLMKIFGSFATLLPIRLNVDQSDNLEDQITAVSELFGQAQAFKRSPRQIARLASSEVSIKALTGLQFLFSYMDFENLRQPRSDHLTIRWELSQTELQPPRLGTDIVLVGRALGGRLRLTFTAGSHAMSHSQLEALVTSFRKDLISLLQEQKTSVYSLARTVHLDAALIAYLPSRADVSRVMGELGIKADFETIREVLFPQGQPSLLESSTSRLGRTATVCIPWYADELDDAEPNLLVEAVVEAGRVANNAGARCVSLAGMLPSKTRYGFAVLEMMDNEYPLQITTGHSLTAVTVVKNIGNVIKKVNYEPKELTIAFLGLGSVGGSVALLYLAQEVHPRKIVLCDVAASRDRLEGLAEQIRAELNYTGRINVVTSHGQTPSEVYLADVIVGASSQPNILDVERLKPGTIVVDDSFPNCFDRSLAIKRMKNIGDVLLVGAGLLDCGPVDRELMLPPGAPPSAGRILDYFPSTGSPGCQLESLLKVRQPELPLTHGLVALESACAYWQAIGTLNIDAASLHLGNYLPDAKLVRSMKSFRENREYT
jgi:amino acid adenylation domain-containing protein